MATNSVNCRKYACRLCWICLWPQMNLQFGVFQTLTLLTFHQESLPGKTWLSLDFCKPDSATVSKDSTVFVFVFFSGGKEKKKKERESEGGREEGRKERRKEGRKEGLFSFQPQLLRFYPFSSYILGVSHMQTLPFADMTCASTSQYHYTYTPQYLLLSSPWLKSSLSFKNQFKPFPW